MGEQAGLGLGLDERQERAFAALMGALVADAAALGFHWLYDVERLAERGGAYPEFHTPQESDYLGVGGYFAHAGKVAGDLSHYGESFSLVARTLLAREGRYEVRAHQSALRAFFGPGGSWRGYVDRPTKGTLANLERGEQEAQAAGLAAASAWPEPRRAGLVARLLPQVRQLTGAPLLEAARASLPADADQDELAAAEATARALDQVWPDASGDADQQVPALTALVPLLVLGADDATLERAIRVTHHDDEAVAWSLTVAAGLRAALAGAAPSEAVAAIQAAARGAVAERLAAGLALTGSPVEVIGELGRNCALQNTVPGLLQLCARAECYEEPVRANVAAGGDSCGRALVLGALLGAAYGVGGSRGLPYPWLARLTRLDQHVATSHALARLAR